MATGYSSIAVPAPAAAGQERRRYLFGPVADFVTFGGLSLVLFPLLLLLPLTDQVLQRATLLTVVVAHLVNHPHFAHSYQIFYRGFHAKALGTALGPVMRARYLFAGIAVPLLLAGYLGWGFLRADARMLGYAANAMALFVGWHYVKQGYGLLMVDCALKRQFFSAADKKVLLVNCYVVWAGGWLLLNQIVHVTNVLGLAAYALALPVGALNWGLAAAMTTTIAAGAVVARQWRKAGSLPLNGLAAYVASLYLWFGMTIINPLWALLAPAFHSLQYLAVVWRFESNRERAVTPHNGILAHTGAFALGGVLLGYLGFQWLPALADLRVAYDSASLGPTFFGFAALIFINVHHYFIDNVIWRRENPETQAHLFA